MSRKKFTERLFSLGCAYSYTTKIEPADLEYTILKSLKYYWESNDLFFMMYGLLHHKIGHLVHVERLIKLVKKNKINNDEKILLVCVANKLIRAGYKNFDVVEKKLITKKIKFKEQLPESESDSFIIERWGLDQDLKVFGAEVRVIPLEDEKKFLSFSRILNQNKWLALRAIVGPNNRADIIYLKTESVVQTANQAAKILSCSNDAAYRYWNSVKQIEALKLKIK